MWNKFWKTTFCDINFLCAINVSHCHVIYFVCKNIWCAFLTSFKSLIELTLLAFLVKLKLRNAIAPLSTIVKYTASMSQRRKMHSINRFLDLVIVFLIIFMHELFACLLGGKKTLHSPTPTIVDRWHKTPGNKLLRRSKKRSPKLFGRKIFKSLSRNLLI